MFAFGSPLMAAAFADMQSRVAHIPDPREAHAIDQYDNCSSGSATASRSIPNKGNVVLGLPNVRRMGGWYRTGQPGPKHLESSQQDRKPSECQVNLQPNAFGAMAGHRGGFFGPNEVKQEMGENFSDRHAGPKRRCNFWMAADLVRISTNLSDTMHNGPLNLLRSNLG